MPVDTSGLTKDPEFLALPATRRAEILRGLAAQGELSSPPPIDPPMPMASPIATPSAAPTPTSITPMAPPPSGISGPMDPQRWFAQGVGGLTKRTEDALESVQKGYQRTIGKHLPSWVPNPTYGSVPEIVGTLAQMAAGNEAAALPLAGRLIIPPVAAALSSYLSGSKIGPLRSGLTTGFSTLVGEGGHTALKFNKGRAAAKALELQRGKDLSDVGRTMGDKMPEVSAGKVLKTPNEMLGHFGQNPEKIVDPTTGKSWGYYKQMGEFAEKQAKAAETRLAALSKRLDTADKHVNDLMSKGGESPANSTAEAWLGSSTKFKSDMAQAKGRSVGLQKLIQREQKEVDRLRKVAQEFTSKWEKRSKPFEALRDVFGGSDKYGAGTGKGFVPDIRLLQEKLADPKQLAKLRDAGVTDDWIDEARRIVFGAPPGTTLDQIMKEIDINPTEFHAGGRGHMQHAGMPMLGVHINIPEAAKLAGERQLAIDPSNLWKYFVENAIGRTVYGIGEPGSEPEYHPEGPPE